MFSQSAGAPQEAGGSRQWWKWGSPLPSPSTQALGSLLLQEQQGAVYCSVSLQYMLPAPVQAQPPALHSSLLFSFLGGGSDAGPTLVALLFV